MRGSMLILLVTLAGCASPVEPVELGVYHLDGVDATNLELASDGTFRWGIFGCDFAGAGAGLWRVDGDALVLHPVEGEQSFTWVHDGSFAARMTRLEVRHGDTPEVLEVRGMDDLEQTWAAGGTCAICGDDWPGPTGTEACDDPYLGGPTYPGG